MAKLILIALVLTLLAVMKRRRIANRAIAARGVKP